MPSSIPNGDLIVPTLPSTQVGPPPPATPTGLVALNPNTGTQTLLASGSPYNDPAEVVECPTAFIRYLTPGPQSPQVPPSTPGLLVADEFAGTNGLGAIIAYSPSTGTSQILADSGSGGLIDDPVALAFQNQYLYVANCGNKTLVRIDPTNHWSQSYVTVNGMTSGFFTVVTDLKAVPGTTNELYLLDEGGFINDPGAGQVWKLTFSDTLHATETAFGPQFPTSPDYRHPQAMTQDLR